MSSEKVLITGGCGFIGANLVRHLLDRGRCQITVYDNLSVGSRSNLERAIADSGRSDGSVDFVSQTIDIDLFGKLATMAGNEPASLPK